MWRLVYSDAIYVLAFWIHITRVDSRIYEIHKCNMIILLIWENNELVSCVEVIFVLLKHRWSPCRVGVIIYGDTHDRACRPHGHNRDEYRGVSPSSKVPATHLKIGHPYRVPDLQMSCRDLTTWQGIGKVAATVATMRHALLFWASGGWQAISVCCPVA